MRPTRSGSPGRPGCTTCSSTYEAMTPGEYKQQGARLVIRYGVHPTPFGEALLLATERGIAGLSFVDGEPGGGARGGARGLAAEPPGRGPGRDRRADPPLFASARGGGRRRSSCSRAPTSRSRSGRRCCGCRPGAWCPTSTSRARSASRGRCARSARRSRATRSASRALPPRDPGDRRARRLPLGPDAAARAARLGERRRPRRRAPDARR